MPSRLSRVLPSLLVVQGTEEGFLAGRRLEDRFSAALVQESSVFGPGIRRSIILIMMISDNPLVPRPFVPVLGRPEAGS
jgi:hypothetical protein